MRRKDTNSQPKEHKTFKSFQLKLDEALGIAEEIVAVMGNIDEGDDVIHPGAFSKTIQERGHKIKVLDQHGTDSVLRCVGKPLEIRELSKMELPPALLAEYPMATGALAVKTQYFMDTPEGKGTFLRVKEGVLEYSIGYDAQDVDWSKVDIGGGKTKTVRNLRTIKLYEYSPVLWGMNSATMTVSAKSEDAQQPPTPVGKSVNLTELVSSVASAFCELHNAPDGTMEYYVREVHDDHLIACRFPREGRKEEYFSVPYTNVDGIVNFPPVDKWTQGSYVFQPLQPAPSAGLSTAVMSADNEQPEAKAGRVLSRRNAEALRNAVTGLVDVMKAAGVWADPNEDDDEEEQEEGKSNVPSTSTSEAEAADLRDNEQTPKAATQAGPPIKAPTDWKAMIELEQIGLDLFKLRKSEVRS